jgi:hypothetical protein
VHNVTASESPNNELIICTLRLKDKTQLIAKKTSFADCFRLNIEKFDLCSGAPHAPEIQYFSASDGRFMRVCGI